MVHLGNHLEWFWNLLENDFKAVLARLADAQPAEQSRLFTPAEAAKAKEADKKSEISDNYDDDFSDDEKPKNGKKTDANK